MNNEQLVNDIVNSLVSKIADAAVTRVEERFNALIDEKLKNVGHFPKDLLESSEFIDAVNDAVDRDSIVSDAAEEAQNNLDIEETVRDIVRNLSFSVEVH